MVMELMDWRREQWAVAFREQGIELTHDVWRDVFMCDKFEPFERVMEGWWKRHVYDPLCSPIVIPDSYRVRTAC